LRRYGTRQLPASSCTKMSSSAADKGLRGAPFESGRKSSPPPTTGEEIKHVMCGGCPGRPAGYRIAVIAHQTKSIEIEFGLYCEYISTVDGNAAQAYRTSCVVAMERSSTTANRNKPIGSTCPIAQSCSRNGRGPHTCSAQTWCLHASACTTPSIQAWLASECNSYHSPPVTASSGEAPGRFQKQKR
jgi:hypothetical protein